MLEQRDHRGKRFTINYEDATDEIAIEPCRRAKALERQARDELCELERAKAVAGPAGKHPDDERTVGHTPRFRVINGNGRGESISHVAERRISWLTHHVGQ